MPITEEPIGFSYYTWYMQLSFFFFFTRERAFKFQLVVYLFPKQNANGKKGYLLFPLRNGGL